MTFASPVPVSGRPGVRRLLHGAEGRYAWLADAFELAGVEADPLSVAGGFAPADSGVYGAPGAFPTTSSRNSNYYVDVLFNASGPPDPVPTIAVASRQPAPDATGVPTSTAVTVSLSAPIDPGSSLTVSQGSSPVAGTVATSNGGTTLTFTPTAALAPGALTTASLAGVTSTDGIDLAPESWSFTTAAVGPVVTDPPGSGGGTGSRTASLFGDRKPRGALRAGAGVEVGVEFTATKAGSVEALRYFQVSGRAAPRSVTLWSAAGKQLARAKIGRKGAKPKKAGWRTVVLDDPVLLTAGRSYVASYYLPGGKAARTPGFYKKKSWSSGPLRAKRADNGRYAFSSKSRFPKKVDRGVNFYADVRFTY